MLYHFSEDPAIERFVPHVPRTNPSLQPGVWAIDYAHSPLYWFPRDCPRVTAFPRNDSERRRYREAFCTIADRVHAIETGWLHRVRTATLYRYSFEASAFRPWPESSGQWISESIILPVDVEPLNDLLGMHADAMIDLRVVPDLWPIYDLAMSDQWDYSMVRMRNARPRR